MKKFLLATLLGTSLMTTFAGASSAFALEAGKNDQSTLEAGKKEQAVKVSYTSTAAIATAKYMVAIPTALTISSDTKQSNFTVDLYNKDGGDYAENKKIKISVKSENGFKLTGNAGNASYSLYFDGVVCNGGENSGIELSQNKKSITGVAEVKDGSIKPGSYLDVLTFKVTSDDTEL